MKLSGIAIRRKNIQGMKLKISLIQTDIKWGDAQYNLNRIEATLKSLKGTDIAVLPEMFATGFMIEGTSHGESMDGSIVTWMRKVSREYGFAVAGTVAVCDDDHHPEYNSTFDDGRSNVDGSMLKADTKLEGGCRLKNRFVFATPDGCIETYDKRHLFSYGGENKSYTGGQQRVVFEYKGFRIMPQICYDLRFPVWCRNRGDYDLLLYVASWPTSRISVWDTLLKARAIENQCYVVGVNRVGSDPVAEYCGHSAAVDFKGLQIAAHAQPFENILTVELDSDKLQSFREKFRAWEDADVFQIG